MTLVKGIQMHLSVKSIKEYKGHQTGNFKCYCSVVINGGSFPCNYSHDF
jgi:hypothetical protein